MAMLLVGALMVVVFTLLSHVAIAMAIRGRTTIGGFIQGTQRCMLTLQLRGRELMRAVQEVAAVCRRTLGWGAGQSPAVVASLLSYPLYWLLRPLFPYPRLESKS